MTSTPGRPLEEAGVASMRGMPRLARDDWAARGGWIRAASIGFSLVAGAFFVAMIVLFVVQSIPVWRSEGLGFLFTNRWYYRGATFGALAMIYGTVVVSAIALAIAAPIGIGSAIFTAEILPSRLRTPVKIVIELLAGIPSVVYGLLGIVLLRDWMFTLLQPFDPLSGDTLLTAGVLLAVMVLPTVMTIADDALRGVPAGQRSAARGLGLTRAETLLTVTLPQAWRGIGAAVLLALGRALGEGIAVYMVIGRRDNQWPANPLSLRPLVEAGQTVNTKLVGAETHIAYGDPLHWAAIVNLALVLLVLTSVVTWLGVRCTRRKERHAQNA